MTPTITIDSTLILSECPLSGFMTKWEYLVVNPIFGHLKGSDGYGPGVQIGFRMNEKVFRFKTIMEETTRREKIDPECENLRRWGGVGNYRLLNELGDEGWELIKIRDSPLYFFKRPL